MPNRRLIFEQKLNKLSYQLSTPYYDFFDKSSRLFSFDREDLRHILMDNLDIQEGEKIIDIGCGTGLQIPYYPDQNEVYCVDINKGPLKRARRKAKKYGKDNIEFYLGDAKNLEFERNSFDIAILIHALSTIPGNSRVMNQVVKVVKNGGRIGIIDFNNTARHPFYGTTYLQLNGFIHNLYNTDKEVFEYISSDTNKNKEDIYILKVDKL